MRIIYDGAEYYLSCYLNGLKIPMVLFIVITVLLTIMQIADSCKDLKETWLYKHRLFFAAFTILTSAYLFLVWR